MRFCNATFGTGSIDTGKIDPELSRDPSRDRRSLYARLLRTCRSFRGRLWLLRRLLWLNAFRCFFFFLRRRGFFFLLFSRRRLFRFRLPFLFFFRLRLLLLFLFSFLLPFL